MKLKLKLPSVKLPFATKKNPLLQQSSAFHTQPLSAVVLGDIVAEYDVGKAHVIIADSGEKHLYLVQEPPLS